MSANADGPTATSCRITTSSGAMCSVATCSKRQRSQQTLSRNRRSVSRKLWLPPPVAMLVRPEDVGFGRVACRGPPFSAVLPSGVGTPRERPLLAFRHTTYSPIPTAPPEYTSPAEQLAVAGRRTCNSTELHNSASQHSSRHLVFDVRRANDESPRPDADLVVTQPTRSVISRPGYPLSGEERRRGRRPRARWR